MEVYLPCYSFLLIFYNTFYAMVLHQHVSSMMENRGFYEIVNTLLNEVDTSEYGDALFSFNRLISVLVCLRLTSEN